jgi:hypothetical protein
MMRPRPENLLKSFDCFSSRCARKPTISYPSKVAKCCHCSHRQAVVLASDSHFTPGLPDVLLGVSAVLLPKYRHSSLLADFAR